MQLTFLDWSVILVYLSALIGMSVLIGRSQKGEVDYFLGGRGISSFAIALSIMATQCSSVSMISAPAFVALNEEGGLLWLQYELAVPLAMVVLMVFFIPVFYKLKITTVYEYLERRFNYSVRCIVSCFFQLSRGLATGVAIYAVSIVSAVCFGLPLWLTILLTGLISTIYTMLGGIKAVIYTDALQIIVLWISVFICLGYGLFLIDDWQGITSTLIQANLEALDFRHHGFGDGRTFSFWPMLLGGLFLYIAYYGCDQSQVQRVLCARSVKESNRALFINGMLRFPLVASYCALGVFMIVFLADNPELRAAVPGEHYDYLIPLFIVNYLPHGVIGFVLVGIFAAAMSSLDSAINSLSAATIKDLLMSSSTLSAAIQKRFVFCSRLTTLFWGILCTLFAYQVGNISTTVLEGVNKIGSVFYGPLLAVFALGIVTRSAGSAGVIIGLFAGIACNVLLWAFSPDVSWLWWNVTGCGLTFAVGMAVTIFSATQHLSHDFLVVSFMKGWENTFKTGGEERGRVLTLIFYFLILVCISWGVSILLRIVIT
jgi:SSS family solute:Na+ symporter